MKEESAADTEGEEEGGGIASGLLILTTEMANTNKEAVEGLVDALGMEVEEDEGSEG